MLERLKQKRESPLAKPYENLKAREAGEMREAELNDPLFRREKARYIRGEIEEIDLLRALKASRERRLRR